MSFYYLASRFYLSHVYDQQWAMGSRKKRYMFLYSLSKSPT